MQRDAHTFISLLYTSFPSTAQQHPQSNLKEGADIHHSLRQPNNILKVTSKKVLICTIPFDSPNNTLKVTSKKVLICTIPFDSPTTPSK